MKMEGHIQRYLKDEVSLKRIIKKRDKEFWIRIFLSQIDIWATSHGMADGASGEGDLLLALSDKKTGKGRDPLIDTCNCLECDCWACNGVGFLAGEGRKVCLCYNKNLPMPKGTTDNQEWAVKTCRIFLQYEPDFAPNIKALPMKEIFIRTKAHVDAEKAAKKAKGSFRPRPNPGRSDPDNRFHGQSSTPMVDGVEVYFDDLAECMRLHELNLQGDGEVHAPLVEEAVEEDPMTPGEQWAADMDGHEEEALAEISGAEELKKVQTELEALKRAVHQDALRAAPGTREDFFKTPASTTNLTHFSQRASTPMDRMRQMQLAEESPMPKESPATSKKPPASANALVGKVLSAFEAEKQEIKITADSPWNAIRVLLSSSGKLLLSANAGRSLMALAAVFLMRYRHLILRKAMWKLVQVQGTVSFVMQWAVAKTVLSAQHRAKLLLQAGFEHFGGQVAKVNVEWIQAPTSAPEAVTQPQGGVCAEPVASETKSTLGVPPVTRSFTPVLPPVPGSPSSPALDEKRDVAAVAPPSPADEATLSTHSLSMSQIVEAAVVDALARQQVAFTSMVSEKMSTVIGQLPVPGKPSTGIAAGALSDQGGQSTKPVLDAGGQSISSADSTPAVRIEVVPVPTAPTEVSEVSSPVVNGSTVPVNGGETITMMCDGAIFESLGEIQAALRKTGGAVAMADTGCTFSAMKQSERVGLIEKTFIKYNVPVTIGDSSSVNFSGTDLYCCKMGGRGLNAYDVLFRAGTYPDNGIGNVMSGTILQSIFDFSSSPVAGVSFSLPGSPPLTPVIAPNSTAFLTLIPLVGPRCAALYKKAIRDGMNTRDIHFMCVLPSPVEGEPRDEGGIWSGTDDVIMAAIDTRPIKGSLIDDPEAVDLFSGPYTREHSYVSMLEANGVLKATPVDKDPVDGGGEEHNILTNAFYLGLQKKADQGIIGYVHLAPDCKFTCPARVIDRNLGKEDKRSPVMRERGFEDGVLGLSHGHLSLLRQDTNTNIRAAAIAMSMGRNGGIVSFETQADRDDASRPDVFWTGARGHVNESHMSCYQKLFDVLGMQRATTEFCAWPDDKGRNLCQQSTDFYFSPSLEPLGRDLEDARCGCGPYGHSSNLGKGADGSFGTAGSGPYPHGLIACMAVHVGAWFVNRRPSPHSKEIIASFQTRAANMEKPRGAAAGPVYDGLELLIRVHVEIFHASEKMVVNAITLMGLRHRIKPGHIMAFRKWSCAICASVLGRRRVYHARPYDATLPHEGKVWQMDSVALRFAPWFLAVFNDVASTVSFSWPHGSTSSDQMIQVMSRHRAKIRPTHGEIEILFSDPLTAMRSKMCRTTRQTTRQLGTARVSI